MRGIRLIPVSLVDVAGLVPGAHEGKGLGNQFLNDIMEANGLIHVFDLSGRTDSNGNPTEGYDPANDIKFLEEEIDFWIAGILEKNWHKIDKRIRQGEKPYEVIYDQLAGLGINKDRVRDIVEGGYSNLPDLARKIRIENKPMILAGNKIDLRSAQENYERLKNSIIPVSAESELALRKADRAGLIRYIPGSPMFAFAKKLSREQEIALDFIKENVLMKFAGTGVQQTINKLVFEKLKYIPVYAVEDESKFSDKKGNVLPDVHLLKEGSTALDLAYKIHSDIGDRFIGAIDARTKKKIGKETVLKKNDIIKILTKA